MSTDESRSPEILAEFYKQEPCLEEAARIAHESAERDIQRCAEGMRKYVDPGEVKQ